ncbi:MAG: DUF2189 domain-containing protein [Rhizomicrobium sp.]
MTIRNPIEWTAGQVELTIHALKSAGYVFRHPQVDVNASPEVRRISVLDLRDILLSGLRDFGAYRPDVIFLCFIYPLSGLLLADITLHFALLPLVFPLVSGFALIGPFAAAGLYEMSRRQEQGKPVSWSDAFGVFGSPNFAEIIKLGVLLLAIFLLWLATATVIYRLTLGPAMPDSFSSFVTRVFTTPAGWALIGVGIGVGFVFALVVLGISVVSFPLLLDRPVNVSNAVRTSVRAVILNPIPMLTWGLIVAIGLILGAIPALIGLVIVMPILGHATWHLYRKVVC